MHNLKLSKIQIYLIISFIISACSFSMLISSSFFDVYETYEQNIFNEKYDFISICPKENTNTTYKDISNMISQKITRDFTLGFTADIVDNASEYGKANVIVAASDEFNINKFAKVSGKELTKDDLNSSKKIAIIGRSLKDSVTKENGKNYISIYQQKYEVVGIMPDSCYFNHSSIIPYKSLSFIKEKSPIYTFYINKDSTDRLALIDSDKYNISKKAYVKENPLVHAFKQEETVKLSFIQLIVGLINLFLFSIFYSVNIKRNIAIMRILGAKIKHILKYALGNIIKIATVGIILGLILSRFITKYLIIAYPRSFTSIDLFNVLLTFLICYIVAIIIVLLITHNVMRARLLKEVR